MRHLIPFRVVVSRVPQFARFYFPIVGLTSNLGTAAGRPLPGVWYVELTAFGWIVTVLPKPAR
jgi:hypothetical protein